MADAEQYKSEVNVAGSGGAIDPSQSTTLHGEIV
jgi:hypothetical protein